MYVTYSVKNKLKTFCSLGVVVNIATVIGNHYNLSKVQGVVICKCKTGNVFMAYLVVVCSK